MSSADPKRRSAIISYSHTEADWGSEQIEERLQTVHRLVFALRIDGGIAADADIFHQNEDWTRWGPRQVEDSDFVLVIASPAWRDAWSGAGDPLVNKGVRAEADVVRSLEAQGRGVFQRRVRLIMLPGSTDEQIPMGMHGIARYRLTGFELGDLEPLLRDLTDQPRFISPPVGKVPAFPPAMTTHTPDVARLETLGAETTTLPPSVSEAGRSERIRQLQEQLEALPLPLPGEGPHLPWFRMRSQIEDLLFFERGATTDTSTVPMATPQRSARASEAAPRDASAERPFGHESGDRPPSVRTERESPMPRSSTTEAPPQPHRHKAVFAVVSVFALVIAIGGLWWIAHSRDGEEADAAQGKSTGSDLHVTPSPVPIVNQDGAVAPATLKITGALTVVNETRDGEEPETWISATSGDVVRFKATLANESDRAWDHLTFAPRLYQSNGPGNLLMLALVVAEGEGEPWTEVNSNVVGLEDDGGGCSINTGSLQQPAFSSSDGRATLSPVPASQVAGEFNVHYGGEVVIPPVQAGQTFDLTGSLSLGIDAGSPSIDGGPNLKFRDAGDDSEYSFRGVVAQGEKIRVSLALHNGSCNTGDLMTRAKITSQSSTSGESIEVRARASWLNEAGTGNDHTLFGPIILYAPDLKNPHLIPIEGSTQVLGPTCDGHEVYGRPAEPLDGVGVPVSVPGYIPGSKCEEHLRWVQAEYVVVGDE